MALSIVNDPVQQTLLRAHQCGGLAGSTVHVQALTECGLMSRRGQRFHALPATPLDARRIADALSADTAAALERLEVHARVASTQPLAEGRNGAFLAEIQTAGRGRHGRRWQAQPGANLQCSVSQTLSGGSTSVLGALPLVIAVALAEVLADWAPEPEQLRIKWPNDLLLNGGKLAGILPDLHWQGGRARAVCGFGINLLAPDGVDQPVGGLVLDPRRLPDRCRLAAGLIDAVVLALQTLERQGFAAFAERFSQRDALHGQTVRWRDAQGREGVGTAAGVAEDGALRVNGEAGPQTLYSGQVQLQKAGQ